MDPLFCPSTETSVDNGLTNNDVLSVINSLNNKIVSSYQDIVTTVGAVKQILDCIRLVMVGFKKAISISKNIFFKYFF